MPGPRITSPVSRRGGIVACVAAVTIALVACGSSSGSTARPTASPSATPSATVPALPSEVPTSAPAPPVATTPTAEVTPTRQELIAVAKRVYGPNFGTCDQEAQSVHGIRHYANCPFTTRLAARYAAYAPQGAVGGSGGGYAFLCHCQNGGPTSYDATPRPGGGVAVVTMTYSTDNRSVYRLTIVTVQGALRVSDIRVSHLGGSNPPTCTSSIELDDPKTSC